MVLKFASIRATQLLSPHTTGGIDMYRLSALFIAVLVIPSAVLGMECQTDEDCAEHYYCERLDVAVPCSIDSDGNEEIVPSRKQTGPEMHAGRSAAKTTMIALGSQPVLKR